MPKTVASAAALFLALFMLACRTNQTPESQASDLRITTEVKARLVEKLKLATLTDINVTTVNGQVTLTGIVDSEQFKQQAAQVAKSVQGVTQVNNNLQVKAAGGGV